MVSHFEDGTLDKVQLSTDMTLMTVTELRQLGREILSRSEGSGITAWSDMIGLVRDEIQRTLMSSADRR